MNAGSITRDHKHFLTFDALSDLHVTLFCHYAKVTQHATRATEKSGTKKSSHEDNTCMLIVILHNDPDYFLLWVP